MTPGDLRSVFTCLAAHAFIMMMEGVVRPYGDGTSVRARDDVDQRTKPAPEFSSGSSDQWPYLRAAFSMMRSAHRPSADEIDRTARDLGIDSRRLSDACRFLGAIDDTIAAGGSVRLCKSTTCLQNGAERFKSELERWMDERGLQKRIAVVYCLEQCAFGPSMAVGRHIYRGGADDLHEDPRPWRREETTGNSFEA